MPKFSFDPYEKCFEDYYNSYYNEILNLIDKNSSTRLTSVLHPHNKIDFYYSSNNDIIIFQYIKHDGKETIFDFKKPNVRLSRKEIITNNTKINYLEDIDIKEENSHTVFNSINIQVRTPYK